MAMITGGTLTMGSAPDDPMRRPGERANSPFYVEPFCIDLYEYPNEPGSVPRNSVSWTEAKAACEARGKRLCHEVEWERACKGPLNKRYPYGEVFQPDTCNTAGVDGVGRKLAASGVKKGCKSGFGVFDLSGNLREWTSSPIDKGNPAYVVRGGSSRLPNWATRCAIRNFAMPSETSAQTGFRCCSDVAE